MKTNWSNNPFENLTNVVEDKQLKVNNNKDNFKERRTDWMRTAKSIFDRDFVEIPKDETNVVKCLKAININLKIFVHLLLNIRTNQVITGKSKGVNFESLRDKDEKDTKPEKE